MYKPQGDVHLRRHTKLTYKPGEMCLERCTNQVECVKDSVLNTNQLVCWGRHTNQAKYINGGIQTRWGEFRSANIASFLFQFTCSTQEQIFTTVNKSCNTVSEGLLGTSFKLCDNLKKNIPLCRQTHLPRWPWHRWLEHTSPSGSLQSAPHQSVGCWQPPPPSPQLHGKGVGCYSTRELVATVQGSWLLQYKGVGCYSTSELVATVQVSWLLQYKRVGCYSTRELVATVQGSRLLQYKAV